MSKIKFIVPRLASSFFITIIVFFIGLVIYFVGSLLIELFKLPITFSFFDIILLAVFITIWIIIFSIICIHDERVIKEHKKFEKSCYHR